MMVIKTAGDLKSITPESGPYVLKLEEDLDLSVLNGSLYNLNGTELIAATIPEFSDFMMPPTVKKLRSKAIASSHIKNVFIANVEEMESFALYDIWLNTFIGGKMLTDLSMDAFMSCEAECIDLSDTRLTEISYRTFSDCSIARIILPESLDIIGSKAFWCKDLIEIDIMNAGHIHPDAFYCCTDLTRILIYSSPDGSNENYVVRQGILYNKQGEVVCKPHKWHG